MFELLEGHALPLAAEQLEIIQNTSKRVIHIKGRTKKVDGTMVQRGLDFLGERVLRLWKADQNAPIFIVWDGDSLPGFREDGSKYSFTEPIRQIILARIARQKHQRQRQQSHPPGPIRTNRSKKRAQRRPKTDPYGIDSTKIGSARNLQTDEGFKVMEALLLPNIIFVYGMSISAPYFPGAPTIQLGELGGGKQKLGDLSHYITIRSILWLTAEYSTETGQELGHIIDIVSEAINDSETMPGFSNLVKKTMHNLVNSEDRKTNIDKDAFIRKNWNTFEFKEHPYDATTDWVPPGLENITHYSGDDNGLYGYLLLGIALVRLLRSSYVIYVGMGHVGYLEEMYNRIMVAGYRSREVRDHDLDDIPQGHQHQHIQHMRQRNVSKLWRHLYSEPQPQP